ncbi:uncharacterized protein J3D65DRAFT_205694 [Phyllosticta citribraziliensis]|uniref:Uncharacterized protein n=1 Tax=Phyllosticta citribraziliensis TaxID=989973 RepID=A0ABR1M3M9_9PEZI
MGLVALACWLPEKGMARLDFQMRSQGKTSSSTSQHQQTPASPVLDSSRFERIPALLIPLKLDESLVRRWLLSVYAQYTSSDVLSKTSSSLIPPTIPPHSWATMSPPPPSAAAAADALCCTTDDQRSIDSEPETPRPTASNARQRVEGPISPRPKVHSSQNPQPTSQSMQPAGFHETEDSSYLDPSIHADGADVIAEIFANAEVSTELESALTNGATEPSNAELLPAERTAKKQKRVAGRATSMLFLRHHMRHAEPDDSVDSTSKSHDRAEDAISGDEATRTGRSKERGKTWGKVKRLTRDLSRSSMNLLMLKKAGEETDKEDNDKPKKKRAKLKKECSSSGSGSGQGLSTTPGTDGADGPGTELHVLVETSVEVLVQPSTGEGEAGHQPSHHVRQSDKEIRVRSPTALDYHYDSDATSLPEIRDSVVERLTRAMTQEEGTLEEKETLVKKERASVEIKALIGESGKTPGDSKFR